jgi:hypothetical protein
MRRLMLLTSLHHEFRCRMQPAVTQAEKMMADEQLAYK